RALLTRNNGYLYLAAQEIEREIKTAISKYGANRVGVVIGTSNSGIDESEQAMRHRYQFGTFPEVYHFSQQEIGSPSAFLTAIYGLAGPAYSVSAACASGGKAFSAAARLIDNGFCDAVLVGGADTLCGMTVGGFRSLQALSDTICNPMSRNRSGTNIGEGAALFLMTKEQSNICFMGAGECSDAYHVSAPEPNGVGAEKAMRQALYYAEVAASDIDYLNLHGTATELNDSMEVAAISRLFGAHLPLSSVKPMTGHTLGAAGAVEAALVWLCLENAGEAVALPPHIWDGEIDLDMPPVNLVEKGSRISSDDRLIMMSNSFAFGGSNVSVILGRDV
ncbi:MAG: beta-ketoacyl-ACP synthase, partial [Sneathiella sp.]